MTDLVTLHIPADLRKEIFACNALETEELIPLHVADISENPDEFALALYADYNSVDTGDNPRGSLIVEMTSPDGAEQMEIMGDVYLVCSDGMAKKFLTADENYRNAMKISAAFLQWVDDFAESNGMNPRDVFNTLMDWIESRKEEMLAEHNRFLAGLVGLSPDQVKIVVL